MLLKLYPENPNEKQVQQVTSILEKDGVIIFPTDSVYAIGCSLQSAKGYQRLCRIMGLKPDKANLSIICHNLSNLSDYTTPIDNALYKLMKKSLPGPFTFILKANNQVPKLFRRNKKTIGIRVPDNNIPRAIVEATGIPLLTASIHSEDEIRDYMPDPEDIHDKYGHQVDLVIDGGAGDVFPSTVVDATQPEVFIVRQGKGELPL